MGEHIGQELHDMEQKQVPSNVTGKSFYGKAEDYDVPKPVGAHLLLWNASCRETSETNYFSRRSPMLKRIAVLALVVSFLAIAAAPETLAQSRWRRDGSRRTVASNYYSPSGYRGVASQRYYSQPYYNNGAGSRYYGRYDRNNHSTRNLGLTVVGPAAVGAGIGAIAGGGKGAGIGAAIGGGGGALFYLLKHHGRRY
jgi:hypothetical protein